MRTKFGFKLALLSMAAMVCAGAAVAQSTTQGAIGGTVEDATGAAIPTATITVRNDGTNATQHLTTDSSGSFKAPLVEPGTYTVTITASGFGTETESHVQVQVGQLTNLMPKLTAGSTEQTVTVSADAAILNLQSPDMTAVLTSHALANIPVQNRRWSSLALMTPGVVADYQGFGLISVRGQSTLLNNVEIDGADDNQAYFSEERGRTREGYSTTPGAIREFDVNAGVYSAQYGRATGAVINSVTKTGANTIHGDVLFSDLDRGFGGYVPGSVSAAGTPLKPKDLRKIYGFSAGGALIKDKLFWFYTYNQLSHIDPAVAQAKSYGNANGSTVGSFLEQPDTTVTSCNLATGAVVVSGTHATLDGQVCTLAARLGLASYAAAVTYYNNAVSGPTGLTSDLGIVGRVGYQEINNPRLDWQINPREHATFLFNRLRWDAPGDVQTNSTGIYSKDAFGADFVKLDYGVAKLESTLSPRINNELIYQYSRELDDEGQQAYTPYTLANLVAAGGSAGGLTNVKGGTVPYIALDTTIGFNLGSPYYSYRIAYPDERKWQTADTLYFQKGNHSLSMGGDIVHNNDLSDQTPYYFGDYTYSTLTNYITDVATKGTATSPGKCNSTGAAGTTTTSGVGTYGCYSSAYQDFGATTYQIATTDYAAFLQDNWKATSRLTLELGVRYDYESMPAPTAALTSAATGFVPYAGITNAPSDKNNLGPRVGFSLDLLGDGTTVLRGGYGLYYGRILNGTVANVQFASGSPAGQYKSASLKPTSAGAPSFPFPLPPAGPSSSLPSSFFLAPNLQNPMAEEMDLQFQRELGRGTEFQISYLGSLGRELPNFLDVNLAPPQDTEYVSIVGGPAGGQSNIAVPTFGTCTASTTCTHPTGYINPNFSNITEVISNINSSYNALVFEIQNRSFHGLQFDANYTWSHALDFNQNASSTTSTNNWLNPYANARQNYGVSQNNVGNRFVGYALYNFPNFVSSGSPLKYVANGWTFNDTFQMQNGLPYSAEIGTGYNSAAALNSSWNGVPSVYYIPVQGLGLNTFEVPRAIVDDIRLQKAFLFADRYNLQLMADVYNIANHQNFSTSDINETAYNFNSGSVGTLASPAILTYQPQTSPNTGFGSHSASNNSGFLYTPREIEIGARLDF